MRAASVAAVVAAAALTFPSFVDLEKGCKGILLPIRSYGNVGYVPITCCPDPKRKEVVCVLQRCSAPACK
jgi:hypothetical protein